ncbi:sigma-54-dependent transcriptional regulator [Desulfatibacillum aliphaticivorans]|uniref:sigma-54-dependent transcriptional regulator n=1 Tax=Desulfatibacillum aliphaticivorans TaxID=218208 RepID=UPI000407A3E0|nr:sigma-54 dependent transcriptional regulator [Desulfatibacillum aliphaticivorans]
MATILIVDDDPQLRQSFERILQEEGHLVHTASSGETGLVKVEQVKPDLVIMDVRMPGMDGLATYKEIRKIESRLPVIIMTAFGTTETAIEATKMGAFDYILKPFDIPAILDMIDQAVKASRFMHSKVQVGAYSDDEPQDALVGASPAMQEIYKAIGRVASTDATVLVRGESGTGKELAARAIYQHSARAHRPFLIINCVAIPPTLLESELFGYEKGAFTGASNRRVGKIERANHGSIFLDEIGDMPLEIQSKILRLLQERSIERLGGREPIPVDVRIIAATNRNLEEAVRQGRFREDLYYRLKVVTLSLPPLRERAGDVPLLAEYFLSRHAKSMGMPNPGLTKDAARALESHPWPGNVRELSNALQKSLIFSKGYPLESNDISRAAAWNMPEGIQSEETDSEHIDALIRKWVREQMTVVHDGRLFEQIMDHLGSLVIAEALRMTGGNRTRAAKILGLSRPTLLSRIEKYDLKIRTSVD